MRYQFNLIKSKRRSAAIKIERNCDMTICVPLHWTDGQIESFINSKSAWIDKTITKLKYRNSQIINPKYGEILYLGEIYLFEKFASSAKTVFINNDKKTIKSGIDLMKSTNLAKFYKEQAKFILPARISKIARQLGFSYTKTSVKNTKKRWGSCSSKGVITLSERLIMTPFEVIDSVIIHELVHTRVMNHSKKFYDMLYEFCPDYDKKDEWLRTKMPLNYPPEYEV